MNLFTELMRIATKIENKEDANIIRQAAVKCLPDPKPMYDEIKEIPGGWIRNRAY